jgi:hypothetical protein
VLNLRLQHLQEQKAIIQARITDKSSLKDLTQAQTKLNQFDPIVVTFKQHLLDLDAKLQEILKSDKKREAH